MRIRSQASRRPFHIRSQASRKSFQEVKSAGIPVILTDRAINSADTTLYRSFIGSDSLVEGRKAGEWLVEQYQGTTGDVNIVEVQGTTGSAPANDRQQGFAEAIAANPRLKMVASQSGNFTRARGKEVMEALLAAHSDIDVLFAHNDDMALGAIQAIEATRRKPGSEIRIVSIDAIHDGMQALAARKINFIVECSPLLGPQLMTLVERVHRGLEVPARVVTDETTFTPDQAQAVLPERRF